MISKLVDRISEFLAHRKGLLPLIGLALILGNLVIQFLFFGSPLATTNLCLHIGIIIAILGMMLSWAL